MGGMIMRQIEWAEQAREVQNRIPPDEPEQRSPSLCEIQVRAIKLAWQCARSSKYTGLKSAIDRKCTVRIWMKGDRELLTVFAIEVSYDGDLSFENPLRNYPAKLGKTK
ncbi:MAG: hypothetical protein KAY37_00725 [Phycisphaerae bacterium]|nr:hypothetical protein [Phycisphaerae bacterium]